MHQKLSWDDARILLAVVRLGTPAAAAKALALEPDWLARRLLRLDEAMGAPLFLHDDGRLLPTDRARRMAERAEEAEASLAAAFAADGEGDAESAGVVRIAAVPMITAHVLAPSLRLLNELAPGVVVELIAVPETQALTWRDADIALRLARPGSSSFLARRIATIGYAVVARRGTTMQPDRLPWIGFDETVAGEPEARWLARREGEAVIARAADIETIHQAVLSGIGRGLLPLAIARRDAALVTLAAPEPPPSRELWLLAERRARQIRRVSLTLGWVEAVVRNAFTAA
jgi:DNA-binding transcriptional LysR family regulator